VWWLRVSLDIVWCLCALLLANGAWMELDVFVVIACVISVLLFVAAWVIRFG